MTNEHIKQAATDFAEREYEISDTDKDSLHKGFYHGALWRINSVWHDAKEVPQNKKEYIIIETKSYDGIVRYDVLPARCYELHPFNEKWAYMSDLLPEGKEDCK